MPTPKSSLLGHTTKELATAFTIVGAAAGAAAGPVAAAILGAAPPAGAAALSRSNINSCSGLSCLLGLQVVGVCGPGYGETAGGLESNCEERTERLAFYDVWYQTGRGYQRRRGKFDSKSSISREVQETYARSTMLKIPCCRPPKASLRDAQASSCIERSTNCSQLPK